MHRLSLIGLNHRTAPLEVREKLALGTAERLAALEMFKGRFPTAEAVLLCTCNRVELYVWRNAAAPKPAELIEFLAAMRNIPASEFSGGIYEKTGRDAVVHLFSVAASLDSMVLGETQILGQVRDAFEEARQAGTAGTSLYPLFQKAVAAGKLVVAQTPLAEGRLSVASIAADYARRIFDTFADKTVLSIGAGKMAGLVLARLAELGPGTLLVCNRDGEKSAALAGRFAGKDVPFDRLADHLSLADIVLSSTGSSQPIMTHAMFEAVMRRRHYRPVFVIDIAVPRDVAAEVGKISNVYLYNLDDLQQAAESSRQRRAETIDAARAIVDDQVRLFHQWRKARQLGPLIDQLYRRAQEVARQELDRTVAKMGDVSDAEREHLEDLARRIVNKLLHDPIRALRDAPGSHGTDWQYAHALEQLFKLDAPADGAAEAPVDPAEQPGPAETE